MNHKTNVGVSNLAKILGTKLISRSDLTIMQIDDVTKYFIIKSLLQHLLFIAEYFVDNLWRHLHLVCQISMFLL